MELVVDGVPHRLTAGKSMILPPNIVHSGKVISDCKVIDVFHPAQIAFEVPREGGDDLGARACGFVDCFR